jgi:hypothetical protein
MNLALLSFGLLFMFTQFQNCAGSSSAAANSGAGTVHLIDGYAKVELQFPLAAVQIYDDAATVNLGGICNYDRNGQALSWSISANGSDLSTGTSACSDGQFAFDVNDVSPWVCGVPFVLQVEASWGAQTSMLVTKRCQPLASQAIAPLASTDGQPVTCSLEYRMDAGQGSCQQACYAQGLLTSSVNQPVDQCQSLIASLSGQ